MHQNNTNTDYYNQEVINFVTRHIYTPLNNILNSDLLVVLYPAPTHGLAHTHNI